MLPIEEILDLNTILNNEPVAIVRVAEPKSPPIVKPKSEPIIEYTVVEGDNLTKIATTYQTTVERLWQKNSLISHPDVLNVGDKLIIPTVTEILAIRELPVVTVTDTVAPVAPTLRAATPGNSYAYGFCTWFVKNMRPDIGNFWGNADRWVASAQAEGYATGPTPVAGAIGMATGYMHVVYVQSVNGDGTVNISEMNYNGWNVISYRTASTSEFYYIY